MSINFQPGDKVTIMYPYPADNPKPHHCFKHGERLVIERIGSSGSQVVGCRRESDMPDESSIYAINVNRLNYLGGNSYAPPEKEALPINIAPFDYFKAQKGQYIIYYGDMEVVELLPFSDHKQYAIKIKTDNTFIVPGAFLTMRLRPLTDKTYYVNIYYADHELCLGDEHSTRGDADAQDLANGRIGLVKYTLSGDKNNLISVELIK